MDQLHEKEAAMLKLIHQSIDSGVIPSVREIGARLGMKSTSTVHRYLTSLEEKGLIVREGGQNRSIRLPGGGMTRVPVVGVVAAGKPLLAVESVEGYVPFSGAVQGDTLFALRVRGDSMINAGILEGDLIIARQCTTARNGEIVVAMIDGEATVKRFYKENGHYRLQPENDTMEPIFADHVTLLGRVVGLQREY